MPAASGLAWISLARSALGWGWWRAAALGLFVSLSPFMVHAIGVEQYQDAAMALETFDEAAILARLCRMG